MRAERRTRAGAPEPEGRPPANRTRYWPAPDESLPLVPVAPVSPVLPVEPVSPALPIEPAEPLLPIEPELMELLLPVAPVSPFDPVDPVVWLMPLLDLLLRMAECFLVFFFAVEALLLDVSLDGLVAVAELSLLAGGSVAALSVPAALALNAAAASPAASRYLSFFVCIPVCLLPFRFECRFAYRHSMRRPPAPGVSMRRPAGTFFPAEATPCRPSVAPTNLRTPAPGTTPDWGGDS